MVSGPGGNHRPCLQLIKELFSNRVLDHLRAAQGVVRLAERYGNQRLDAACARALLFDAPRYRTVKTILENNQEQAVEAANAPLPDIYTGNSRFQRNPTDLLQ